MLLLNQTILFSLFDFHCPANSMAFFILLLLPDCLTMKPVVEIKVEKNFRDQEISNSPMGLSAIISNRYYYLGG